MKEIIEIRPVKKTDAKSTLCFFGPSSGFLLFLDAKHHKTTSIKRNKMTKIRFVWLGDAQRTGEMVRSWMVRLKTLQRLRRKLQRQRERTSMAKHQADQAEDPAGQRLFHDSVWMAICIYKEYANLWQTGPAKKLHFKHEVVPMSLKPTKLTKPNHLHAPWGLHLIGSKELRPHWMRNGECRP